MYTCNLCPNWTSFVESVCRRDKTLQNTYTGCESVTYIPEYQTILTMVLLFLQLKMTLLCVEMLI